MLRWHRNNYGSGSAARLIGTAISGAAGGNVTGSLGSFVQAAAVNALQSLAVRQVKDIADSFFKQDPNYPNNPNARIPTVESEAVRTALQALVGCAGAAPTGNCASGALGASSSVVLNNLITSLLQPEQRDAAGNIVPRSLADQQTRTALIATLTGAIAGALGANAGVASNAGRIETENNALSVNGTTARFAGCYVGSRVCTTEEARAKTDAFFASDPEGRLFLQASNGNQALAESCIRNDSTPACRAVQTRLNELTTARDSIVVRVDLYDLVRNGGALLNSAGQAIGYVDANYGQIVTRTLGVAQGAAGAFDVVAGVGTVAVGAGSCLPTIGAGCAAALGGVVIIGADFDNIYAGGATAIGGRYVSTISARGLSSLTGLSIETTELLYGFSSFGVSAAQGGLQRLVRNSAARAQTRIAGEAAQAEAARLGDSLAGQSFANGVTCVYNCVIGGVTRYVGITDDAARRGAEQLRLRNIKIKEIAGLTNLSRSDARAVEQVLINFHGLGANGGTLINQINSISRITNKTKYEAALVRGAEILRSIRYPGFM